MKLETTEQATFSVVEKVEGIFGNINCCASCLIVHVCVIVESSLARLICIEACIVPKDDPVYNSKGGTVRSLLFGFVDQLLHHTICYNMAMVGNQFIIFESFNRITVNG